MRWAGAGLRLGTCDIAFFAWKHGSRERSAWAAA